MKHLSFPWLACMFGGLIFAAIFAGVTALLFGYKLFSGLFWVFAVMYFLIYYQGSYILARWRDDKIESSKAEKAKAKANARIRAENKVLRDLIKKEDGTDE